MVEWIEKLEEKYGEEIKRKADWQSIKIVVREFKELIAHIEQIENDLTKCLNDSLGMFQEHYAILATYKAVVEKIEESVLEELSAYAHGAWSGWMKYMFGKSTINEDGTMTIPKWAVERWTKQMNLSYIELLEEEKNSDREEAEKMLSIINIAQQTLQAAKEEK